MSHILEQSAIYEKKKKKKLNMYVGVCEIIFCNSLCNP